MLLFVKGIVVITSNYTNDSNQIISIILINYYNNLIILYR